MSKRLEQAEFGQLPTTSKPVRRPTLAGVYILGYPQGVYVGATLDHYRRRDGNLSKLRTGTHHCPELQEAFNKDPNVSLEVIITDPSDRFRIETETIARLRRSGRVVWNRGGEDSERPMKGLKLSAESRKKISAALKGVPHSQETRDAIGRANAGRKRTPEMVARMRIAATGFRHSAETKAIMSDVKKGIQFTASHKRKIGEASAKRLRLLSRPVLINGVRYDGVWDAAVKLNIPYQTVYWRITRCPNAKEWCWADETSH